MANDTTCNTSGAEHAGMHTRTLACTGPIVHTEPKRYAIRVEARGSRFVPRCGCGYRSSLAFANEEQAWAVAESHYRENHA